MAKPNYYIGCMILDLLLSSVYFILYVTFIRIKVNNAIQTVSVLHQCSAGKLNFHNLSLKVSDLPESHYLILKIKTLFMPVKQCQKIPNHKKT